MSPDREGRDYGDGTFHARIPLTVEGYEELIPEVLKSEALQKKVANYAKKLSSRLGLSGIEVIFTKERGLSRVSVSPGDCACISITADSWEGRHKRLPVYSTHNVDNAAQHKALTSVVSFYLKQLQHVAR